MNKFIMYLAVSVSMLCISIVNAQEEDFREKIEALEQQKIRIQEEEREALKEKVEAINEELDNEEITFEEARKQKEEVAQEHALNMENRLAIIDNTIALLERGVAVETTTIPEDDYEDDLYVWYKDRRYDVDDIFSRRHRKYDRRTYTDFVVALGLNHTLIDGQSLEDSPYSIGNSRFFEMGWTWSTRVFNNSNFLRFRYGVSFQFNGLSPKDNMYFVKNDDQTDLEVFPENLNKAKLRMDNLVIPFHFEFGPSRKVEREDYFRYSTYRKFKLGIGGYAGLNIGTRQKLKYQQDGDRIKEKIKNNYNTNTFIYGLSAYIGVGDTSLYVKYDLNPVFNNAVTEQNNISLGLRFDL